MDTDNPQPQNDNAGQHAANLIRGKLNSLYAGEPNAKAEAAEVAEITKGRSKHQQYMYELSHSGKSIAEIQTAWHVYYADLPDEQKHEVWDEFYAANNQSSHFMQSRPTFNPSDPKATVVSLPQPGSKETKPLVKPYLEEHTSRHQVHHPKTKLHRYESSTHTGKARSVAEVKHQLIGHIKPKRKLKAKQHLQSLMFGLGMGSIVLLIMLFSFFNERFIAPFITPSKQVSSTPIIIDPNAAAISPNPEVIIPKINVEIPVIYNQASIEESSMQSSLEQGVVHYATTPYPGEQGNTVIFGHSSNNIFNPGKYKFAFVLLSRLENGDLFYLTRDGKQYVYKVYKKEVVDPTNLSVLNPTDKPATATLITCDPPGTSLHRMVVVGEQITPNPTINTASTAATSSQRPAILPSNSPSLWGRFVNWLTN